MRHAPLLLVLLALLAHGAGLASGFVYDDHRFIVDNTALADLGVQDALLDAARHTADRDRDVYRPLRVLGHALDRRRWGLDPFGFHLHSIVVHVLAVLAAFAVLRRLLAPGGEGPALLGAGLLAVHPLGVEVVGWVSSRGDGYALLFGLLAVGFGAGAWRPPGRLALAAVASFLAVLGKESAAVLPAVVWLHGRWVGADTDARRSAAAGADETSAERPAPLRPWPGVVALAVGVVAAGVLRQLALDGRSPVQTTPHGGDHLSQLGWGLYGLCRTLGHLLWPRGLSVEYPQTAWSAAGLPLLPTLVGLALVLAPFGLRKAGRSRAAFLAAWCLLAYLPSSSLLVTLRELVNDRGVYPVLPAAGSLVGLAVGGAPRRCLGTLLLLSVALVPLSVQRTAVFSDDERLWADVQRVHPRSVRAQMALAVAAPDEPTAHQHLLQARRLAPPGSKLEALVLARLGEHVYRRVGDARAAVPELEHALARLRHWAAVEHPGSDLYTTTATLAEAYEDLGRSDLAEALYDEVLADPAAPPLLYVTRVTLRLVRARRSGRPEDEAAVLEAVTAAERAAPDHPLVQALRPWLAARQAGRDATLPGLPGTGPEMGPGTDPGPGG